MTNHGQLQVSEAFYKGLYKYTDKSKEAGVSLSPEEKGSRRCRSV